MVNNNYPFNLEKKREFKANIKLIHNNLMKHKLL